MWPAPSIIQSTCSWGLKCSHNTREEMITVFDYFVLVTVCAGKKTSLKAFLAECLSVSLETSVQQNCYFLHDGLCGRWQTSLRPQNGRLPQCHWLTARPGQSWCDFRAKVIPPCARVKACNNELQFLMFAKNTFYANFKATLKYMHES